MVRGVLLVALLSIGFAVVGAEKPEPLRLFDGKTFAGWDGDTEKTWRIEDGCLVGGTLEAKIPRNEFLATTKSYANFVLRLKFRLLGDPKKGFVNSGVQIRSERIPNNHEMIGYQADLGDPSWWGCIYDESRRNKVLAQSDMAAINKVLKRGEWNDYEIRAEGRRIRTTINGVLAVDFTEQDEAIPQSGRIGLQIHSGGPAEVWFKDITLEELPATPDPLALLRVAEPPAPPKPSPLSPNEQQALFRLPSGFEIELVAAEPDVGKPITVAWDAAGRMWTMTALEYPVDANESPAESAALFSQGGRDKVLVFDAPYGPGPHQPRTFAEGLAIPLGLLPYRNGCFVQFGPKILYLQDTNGDGRADRREVFLEGFGTEDSHLFPHQFTRGPGGWFYFAQGAFNHSRVQTAEGRTVRMSYCKMARVRLDGTGFELVQAGLNNIWGFVINKHGDMFIQEANDLGYPVVPFEIGANFPGIGMEKLKPYAPWTPPVPHQFQMGGTGLSGLALLESSPFAAAFPSEGSIFFIANPITRRVQAVHLQVTPQGPRLEKLPDFLLCSDPWFRPVAIHFGPDECLYVVDWYNAIISHNEVPRNHPERDKTRGRIWRIRRTDQERAAVPDLTRQPNELLLTYLESGRPWLVRNAWQEIVDRQAVEVADELARRAAQSESAATRLAALWALEGLGKLSSEVVQLNLRHAHPAVRRESARMAAHFPELASRLAELHADAAGTVRAAAIRSLGQQISSRPELLVELLRFAKPELAGPTVALDQGGVRAKLGEAHERDFERYLLRALFEEHADVVGRSLREGKLSHAEPEAVLLVALSLAGPESAELLARNLPGVDRGPNPEELLRLVQFADQPQFAALLAPLLARPALLQALWEQRERIDRAKLAPLLAEPLLSLWRDPAHRELVAKLTGAFQIRALQPELVAVLQSASTQPDRRAWVAALRELRADEPELFAQIVKGLPAGDGLRQEALYALVAAGTDRCTATLLSLAEDLSHRERVTTFDRLLNAPAGAKALIAALERGAFPESWLEPGWIEKLQVVLKGDSALTNLLARYERMLQPVLLLDGRRESHGLDEISLEGPFTVEGWMRLTAPIGNAQSLLGRPGVADFNFHDSRFRLWGGPGLGDLIVAKKPVTPEHWLHVAVTRDEAGRFALYLNGELDTAEGRPNQATWRGLRIGNSNPPQGTAAALAEVRVWKVARTPDQIREHFDAMLSTQPGLVAKYSGESWGRLGGSARIARTSDVPPLLDERSRQELDEKFARFRTIIQTAGDVGRGKEVFAKNCQNCHALAGQGGNIGPALGGAGTLSDEALLRNLLTPSAAMEPGYRLYRVETRSGTLREGFLVRQTDQDLVLRRPGEEDERISAADVAHGGFTRRSVMPEGLLEAMTAPEIQDLFSFLRTLK